MSTGSRVSRVVCATAGLAGLCLAGSAVMIARAGGMPPAAHLAAAAGLFVAAVAVHLHVYRTVQRSRAERTSWRQLIKAIGALGHLDPVTILSGTAAYAAELVAADSAEVIRYASPEAAVGEVFCYPDAEPPHCAYRWTEAVGLPGSAAEDTVGEIRVHFGQPVRLTDRDTAALEALAAATRNALSAADAHAEVAYLAAHDAVTALPNRRHLLDRIDAQLGNADGCPIGMILIRLVDVDDVARALGYEAKDDLLRQVADRLRQACTSGEIPARLDGYDLSVFVPGVASVRDLDVRAESLLASLTAPVPLPPRTISLDAVAGIAYAPGPSVGAAELLRQAAVALARAHAALSPIQRYRAADDSSSGPGTALIAAELQEAIDGDQLTVQYQPIIDLADGTAIAAEAIVCWRHPTRGPTPPHEDLSVLHNAGLPTAYTDWLLHHALTERARWTDVEPSLPISINLPASCLLDSGVPLRVDRALADAGLRADQLMIELPEDATLTALPTTDVVLNQLRDLGVRVAIDDFGSGPGSLTRLSRIPATDLKIAPDIVATMLNVPRARALVAAAAEIARGLDLRVIAVGAHTPEHLLAARDAGAHAAQGDAVHPPLTAGEAHAALQQRTHDAAQVARARVIPLRPDRRGGVRSPA